jgi:hypothetical protein
VPATYRVGKRTERRPSAGIETLSARFFRTFLSPPAACGRISASGELFRQARSSIPEAQEDICETLVRHGKNDIRCDAVPDPAIEDGRDAIIKMTACAIIPSAIAHVMPAGVLAEQHRKMPAPGMQKAS